MAGDEEGRTIAGPSFKDLDGLDKEPSCTEYNAVASAMPGNPRTGPWPGEGFSTLGGEVGKVETEDRSCRTSFSSSSSRLE